jgi:hypothetical protein
MRKCGDGTVCTWYSRAILKLSAAAPATSVLLQILIGLSPDPQRRIPLVSNCTHNNLPRTTLHSTANELLHPWIGKNDKKKSGDASIPCQIHESAFF